MKDFFVSYNSADKAWAEWIAWTLEEAGYSVMIQAWDFRPGGNFVLDMQCAAAECQRTIAVLSEAYLKSAYTQPEWAAAFAVDPTSIERKLIPIRVGECQPDGMLRPIVYVDLVGLAEDAAKQAVLNARQARVKPAQKPPFPGQAATVPEVSAPKPFPGTGEPASKPVVGADVLRAVPVWVGRDHLLRQLEAEFVGAGDEQSESRPVVLALVGQGGIGKTSLAVKLLEAVGVELRGAKLAGSSVYAAVICVRAEEGTSFDEVASALLDALGIELADSVQEAEQKIQQILRGLQQRRYLLLLDNLEVVLHPASQPEAGRALQPELGQLLNALVYRPHQSQVILTSREVPRDLADRRYPNSEPDPMLVKIERLGGVDVTAGAEILSRRQVKDSEADRRWVAERVEGHVFVLTQLAAVAKGKPGYLRQHPELVTQRADLILREQLARQSEPARELLKRMCVLRVGIDIRGLTFLRLYQEDNETQRSAWAVLMRGLGSATFKQPAKPSRGEIEETRDLVNRLVDSCLVQCRYDEHKQENVYELHRLIVEFLQAEYQAELPNLLKRVYSFYRTGKTLDNPKTLEDLRPLYRSTTLCLSIGQLQRSIRTYSR